MTRLPTFTARLPVLSVDRRPDRRVAELHARVVDRGLLRDELCSRALDRGAVGLDRPRRSASACGARLFARVLRDDAALAELRLAFGGQLLIFGVRGVARQLRFGLREQRLVADQVGFRLRERRLERPPIEREEQLPLLDEVAFVKRHFDEQCR